MNLCSNTKILKISQNLRSNTNKYIKFWNLRSITKSFCFPNPYLVYFYPNPNLNSNPNPIFDPNPNFYSNPNPIFNPNPNLWSNPNPTLNPNPNPHF